MKAFAAVTVVLAFGQQIPRPVFQAESNLVPIQVQVLDGRTGHSIGNLTREDFVVFDESESKEIIAFDDGSGPRDIVLLADVSGGHTNEGVHFSTRSLLGLRRPDDRIALMSVSDGPANCRTSLTQDEDEIQRGLDQIFSVDRNNNRRKLKSSRILDGILSAADLLTETVSPRRPLIVVITHNRDGKSAARTKDIVRTLLEASITVEAITIPHEWWKTSGGRVGFCGNTWLGLPCNTSGPIRPTSTFLENLHSVEPVAEATGGQVVHLNFTNARRVAWGQPNGRTWDVQTIADIIETKLLVRVLDQYGLAIRGESSPKPEFRRLTVKLTAEAEKRHPNAAIRTRSGYFTLPTTASTALGTTGR